MHSKMFENFIDILKKSVYTIFWTKKVFTIEKEFVKNLNNGENAQKRINKEMSEKTLFYF